MTTAADERVPADRQNWWTAVNAPIVEPSSTVTCPASVARSRGCSGRRCGSRGDVRAETMIRLSLPTASFAAARRAAVQRDVLADLVAVADPQLGRLAGGT